MKPPKQFMTVRNKQHRQPMNPNVPSPGKQKHAYMTGKYAWERYGKSIMDNPYPRGLMNDAWARGYLEASKIKLSKEPVRAPEGAAALPYGIIVIKKLKRNKFRVKDKGVKPIEAANPSNMNTYLGYIQPPNRKFKRFTRNPLNPNRPKKEKVVKKKEK
jgi:hypothetical protein